MTGSFVFAHRTDWLLTSNKLTDALEHLRKENVPILDLTESNPTRCEFSYPGDAIRKPLACEENLYYTPTPHGNFKAREAVSRYYKEKGLTVSPEQIFLTASTSEGYSYLFRLLANSGEQVLFPRPSYPLFAFLGDLNDVQMDTYPLVYHEKWSIDFDQISDLFCNEPKAFVLVNPNNPTGSFVRREELTKLNKLCRAHNTALICDEVFADFAFNEKTEYMSLAENDHVLTFVLGGVSKTLGLPQMKLSWIIINGPQDLVKSAKSRLEVIADTYLSVNTPTQNALPVWLSHRKEIQKEINTRIRQNFYFLEEQVKRSPGCELLMAEGGWYAVLEIPKIHSEEEWALSFLNNDHVFVHPGYFFDFDSEAFIVTSLLPTHEVFKEGITRILMRINGNKP